MRYTCIASLLIIPIFMTSCTTSSLKDLRIVSFAAFDRIDEMKYMGTVALRDLNAGKESTQEKNEFIDAKGGSLGEVIQKIEYQVPDRLGFAKLNFLLFSDEMAKKDKLEDFLDFAYRGSKNLSSSKVIITRSNATDGFQEPTMNGNSTGKSLLNLVKSAEKALIIPRTNINNLFPLLHDTGRDIVLPYMEWNAKKKLAQIIGAALFHDERFTGQFIPDSQAPLLMMMLKQRSKRFFLMRNLFIAGRKISVTVFVRKYSTNRRLILNPNGSRQMKIQLKLEGLLAAFSTKNIEDPGQFKDLIERKMTEALNEDCKAILELLRSSNCDALGIGRDLMAYHPALWKKMNSRPVMQQVELIPTVEFRIVSEGIKK